MRTISSGREDVTAAAVRRDAAIRAAREAAWTKRQAVMRELERAIEAAWSAYHAEMDARLRCGPGETLAVREAA